MLDKVVDPPVVEELESISSYGGQTIVWYRHVEFALRLAPLEYGDGVTRVFARWWIHLSHEVLEYGAPFVPKLCVKLNPLINTAHL